MTVTWEAVDAIAEAGAARSAEIEDNGELPADLVDLIHDAGVFRMLLPADDGGWDATPAECLRATVHIAAGDGSLGWEIGAAAYFLLILMAVATPPLRKEFFDDPRALLAGGVLGAGTATPVAGGYEVEGSWSFATGCWHASWLGGLCVETPSGDSSNDGPPTLRFVMVPADRAEVHPSWDVVGLRGTGSDTVTLPHQIVPAEWTFLFPTAPDQPLRSPEPLAYYGRGLWPTATAAAATQLGIARRALDEAVTFARAKHRPGTPGALNSEQAFQRDLFAAEGSWRAAYASLDHELEQLWTRANTGEPIDVDTRLRVRIAATHAAHTGAHVVRTCFDLAGATAIGRQHPLARCHRDGTILDHHATVSIRTLEMLGRVSLGLEPDGPFI
jgi:alkylation response protein AidB-like acyl-CoA dehydrogenase